MLKVPTDVDWFTFQNKWTTVRSMMFARCRPAVAAVDGSLYVIGGTQTHEDFYRSQFTLSSVERYDTETNTWSKCPPLPESRAESGAAVLWYDVIVYLAF